MGAGIENEKKKETISDSTERGRESAEQDWSGFVRRKKEAGKKKKLG